MKKKLLKNNTLELEISRKTQQQLAELPNDIQSALIDISYLTSKIDMLLKEVYILSNTSIEWFTEQMEQYPVLENMIEKKRIEFKRDLLKVITKL